MLTEEKVFDTSGKQKANVCKKETVQFPPHNPRSCAKNQNRLPPHRPSQPFHEVEVCRGREASEAKVSMDPLLDNSADNI